ncbi:MAG: 30S ribosomal protein S8 [Opitutales bacterium]
MSHDTIGDFLTIIRNAARAKKEVCSANYTKLREHIVAILAEEGYVQSFAVEGEGVKKTISIEMRYVDEVSALAGIERVSKPGKRIYCDTTSIPKVLGGMGICILTTPKGVLKDSDCRSQKVGGELICKVW